MRQNSEVVGSSLSYIRETLQKFHVLKIEEQKNLCSIYAVHENSRKKKIVSSSVNFFFSFPSSVTLFKLKFNNIHLTLGLIYNL